MKITFNKGFAFIVFFLILSVEVSAQLNVIKGKVKDESQEPLVGATVAVLNSTRRVVTGTDGNFEIQASEEETLQISFLGFETYKEIVGKRSYFEVTLQGKISALDELVVVGYGVQKKVNLTGAVATVNYADEVKSRPVTSTAQILQGLNAGVRINQQSGQPGAESITIRIRGEGTLNSSTPLIIVDGFEGTISNVNPDDIENVSILKDAASAAIYGNRGANGVVLITTKSGSKTPGKAEISYSTIMAASAPASHFNLVSNYADYMTIMNESAENVNVVPPFSQAMIDLWREKEKDPNGISESGYPNYVAYPNTDWMDAIYKNALYQKHNLSVTGSSEKTKYLVSLSYIDNPGLISSTGQQTFQLRTNLSAQVTNWLEVGTKLWGYEKVADVSDIYFGLMSRAVPGIYPYYDGKYGWMENPEQSSDSRNNQYFFDRMSGSDKMHYVNATVFANAKLPLDIKYNVSFNYSRTDIEYRSATKVMNAYSFRRGEYAYFYDNLDNLRMTHRNGFSYRWTAQNNLSWNKTIAEKHDLSAMVGFEASYSNNNSNQLVKQRFENDQLTELNNAIDMNEISGSQTDFAAVSAFGRFTYAYDSKYLLEANIRYDGSSRFASQSRWGLFPSVSAAYRISEEAFMQNSGIDNLKLRVSWGKLGNNSIGNYDYLSTYASGYQYSFGNKLTPGIVSTLSNNALKWETTTSTNIGLDLAVLRNRLTLETDIYNKVTDGILYRAPVYATIGNKSAPYQNLCEVTNKGFELTVGWKDRVKDFYYGVSANFTRNWNQVSKYNGRLQAGWETDEYGHRTYKSNIGDVSTVIDPARRTMEGKIINEHYLLIPYSGDASYFFSDGSVNPKGGPRDGMIRTPEDMAWLEAMVANGSTFLPNKTISKTGIWYGDYIFQDVNGDGVYGDANDYTFQNISKTPKYYYGFQVELGWKGIDFSMLLEGAGGSASYWRYVGFNAYSTGRAWTLPKEIAYDHYFYDPANPEDPRTNITSKHGRLTMNYGSEQNGGSNYSTVFLYKTDYLRLKNITIGYTFPKKWISATKILSDVRIFFSGENLITFTDFPGIDPEMPDMMNYYALLKQYSFGLSIKF
jgi:TonB-linked SusC/RagA family outer membrane protein